MPSDSFPLKRLASPLSSSLRSLLLSVSVGLSGQEIGVAYLELRLNSDAIAAAHSVPIPRFPVCT